MKFYFNLLSLFVAGACLDMYDSLSLIEPFSFRDFISFCSYSTSVRYWFTGNFAVTTRWKDSSGRTTPVGTGDSGRREVFFIEKSIISYELSICEKNKMKFLQLIGSSAQRYNNRQFFKLFFLYFFHFQIFINYSCNTLFSNLF